MCCNGSKKVIQQLHAVASTWSSCIELPIQHLFLGIFADAGLTIYDGNVMNVYTHSPVLKNTYLQVEEAYAEWCRDKYKTKLSKRMVLHIKHALQGHSKSGKSG